MKNEKYFNEKLFYVFCHTCDQHYLWGFYSVITYKWPQAFCDWTNPSKAKQSDWCKCSPICIVHFSTVLDIWKYYCISHFIHMHHISLILALCLKQSWGEGVCMGGWVVVTESCFESMHASNKHWIWNGRSVQRLYLSMERHMVQAKTDAAEP